MNERIIIEACIDSAASAIESRKGGADRVELCANLFEGGTTPPAGIIRVTRESINIGLHVIIRPRGGDFLYSDLEFQAMKYDVAVARDLGADGVVIGILDDEGRVDVKRCGELLALAHPMKVTFHRAFDLTPDPFVAMEGIIDLGCERILTSGQESTVIEGLPLIRRLVEEARERIIIMPGAGITLRNIPRVLEETGAKECHVLINRALESGMKYRPDHMYMGGTLRLPEFQTGVIDNRMISALRE